jgi:MYXO-CTERM domain-containing protein
MPPCRLLAVATILTASFASSPAAAAVTPVDDFESAGSPAPWVLGTGTEFPGAKGSLTLAPGRGGNVAHLAYDFSCTGDAATCDPHYVQAQITPPSPLAGSALVFFVRASNATVKVRAVDSTGQTLQYDAAAAVALEADVLDAWHRVVVPLGASDSHWGGANDGIVHPDINSIAILAEGTSSRGTGFVDFDDVAMASTAAEVAGSYDLDPARASFAAIGAAAATLSERLGVNIHFTSDDRALDLVKAAGFSWIRMDLGWAGVERVKGTYDFSAFDTLVASAEARSMHTLLILDYGNPLYTAAAMTPPTSPDAVAGFGAYAEAAAKHFAGRDVMFEVWNEPDIPQFWAPAADTAQYEAVLREAIAHVHAGNAAARVITGGLSNPRAETYAMLEAIFADGGAAGANGVGMHLYIWAPPENRYADVLRLRALIADRLDPVPLYCTEWGFNSTRYATPPDGHTPVGRQRQAVMDVREVLMGWRAALPMVIVYDIRDDGDDPAEPEHNFGILARDYTDKPAMSALRTLSGFASQRRLTAIANAVDAPPGLHVLRLDGASDRVLVVWTEIEGATVNVTLPTTAVASAVTMYGDPIAMADDGGRETIVVGEEAGPVYVTLRAPIGDAGAADASTATDATAPHDAQSPDAPSAEQAAGCGCHAAPRAGFPWPIWLAALVVVARRRPKR